MSFTRYTSEDITLDSKEVVRGCWSGDLSEMTAFYKSSLKPEYYHSVYRENPAVNTAATPQFDVLYGNLLGSGSVNIRPGVDITPSRIIYGQYRTSIYGSELEQFSFNNSAFTGVVNDIFIININRSRYKQSVNPGSLKLTLKNGANVINLTDNSKDLPTTKFIESNRYFDLVVGTAGKNTSSIINPNGSYGYVFPDLGIIIVNPFALAASVANGGIGFNIGAIASDRHGAFLNLITAGASFTAQSYEVVSSALFFSRVKNKEYNYTTNPSIIDDNGNIINSSLISNPQTFITTVGLYNDNGDLLAVAKLSKPIAKSFASEMLLRIKLDF